LGLPFITKIYKSAKREKPPLRQQERLSDTSEDDTLQTKILYHLREQLASVNALAVIFVPQNPQIVQKEII